LDLKEIKQIIDLMKRSDLTELEVEQEGLKLRICRGPGGHYSSNGPTSVPSQGGHETLSAAPSGSAAQPAAAGEGQAGEGFAFIRSPMVGTFYRSAAPDVAAFVEVDSKVSENSVICIIEAMKVMNEIQAEVKGTVVEILVDNGQPVEYGQPLFKVRKG
jgi:acetyl-CoA carboxylase biotin carboxyl carrier protein